MAATTSARFGSTAGMSSMASNLSDATKALGNAAAKFMFKALNERAKKAHLAGPNKRQPFERIRNVPWKYLTRLDELKGQEAKSVVDAVFADQGKWTTVQGAGTGEKNVEFSLHKQHAMLHNSKSAGEALGNAILNGL
jgi:hypothetical protein